MSIEIGPGQSLWELVERRAAATPTEVFAVDDRGRTLSFGGLHAQALDVAAALVHAGVEPEDTVSWILPTCLEAPVLACALDRLGVTQNPVIPQLRRREVSFITRQLGSAWLLVPASRPEVFDHEAMARDVAADVGGLQVLALDRDGPLPRADGVALPERRQVDLPWALYTSGTSGDPKGVRHAHSSVVAASITMCDRLEIDADDRTALAFPFTHMGGINFLMASLMTRCQLIVIESFAAAGTMKLLSSAGMTLGGVTTAFHLAYLEAQRANPAERLFPRIRAYPGGGAPKPPALHYDLISEVGGVGIIAGFGLTEFPMIAMASIHDPSDKLAISEGRPSPGVDVRIASPDGTPLPAGVDGEIRAKGPHLMAGYVDGSLHADAFDGDGYFRTGDLGHVDADGYVVVTGRLKDVIVRKAENISARELEDVIHTHELVAEVAVIGVPDEERGEMVCAVVVPRSADDPPSLAAICEQLRSHEIMVQKLPERLELVDELPRSDTGKILKAELRRRFGGGDAAAVSAEAPTRAPR